MTDVPWLGLVPVVILSVTVIMMVHMIMSATGVMVLLRSRITTAGRVAFLLAALDPFVLLHRASPAPTLRAEIGMRVITPIAPIPAPARVADVHFVPIPVKARCTPSPRSKGVAQ